MLEKTNSISSSSNEEDRLLMITRALLSLKRQPLILTFRSLPRDLPQRLDYANASSWLRGIPGRFGIKKQYVLLNLLGYNPEQDHLRTDQVHIWFPPPDSGSFGRGSQYFKKEVEDFLKKLFPKPVGHKEHFRRRRIVNKYSAPLGWAIWVKGATILFPIKSLCSEDDLNRWFKKQGLDCLPLFPEKTLPEEKWKACLEGKNLDALWNNENSAKSWEDVIQAAKSKGLKPEDVLALFVRCQAP